MKNKNFFLKSMVMGLALLLTTACSFQRVKTSDELVKKFKENFKAIKSVDSSFLVEMTGQDSGDEISFQLMVDTKVDQNDAKSPKMEIELKAEGDFGSGEQRIDGKLHAQLKMFDQNFYFNILDIASTDPTFNQFAPLLATYKNKWQKLGGDLIPDEVKTLQEKDEETLKKEDALKELFVNTKLFNIKKNFSVEGSNEKVGMVLEQIDERELYHLQVEVNKEGYKTYIAEAARLNDQELTTVDLEEAAKMIDAIQSIDLWISPKDFYPYQVKAKALVENLKKGVASNFEITYKADSYNEDYEFIAPEDPEEFNPLALFMGMQAGGAAIPTDLTDAK